MMLKHQSFPLRVSKDQEKDTVGMDWHMRTSHQAQEDTKKHLRKGAPAPPEFGGFLP